MRKDTIVMTSTGVDTRLYFRPAAEFVRPLPYGPPNTPGSNPNSSVLSTKLPPVM